MKRIALFVTFLTVVGSGACKSTPKSEPAPSSPTTTAPEKAPEQKVVAPDAAAAGSAAATNDPWKKDAPKQKDPLPHPMFWSIEKDGKTSYVLGTIHVGDRRRGAAAASSCGRSSTPRRTFAMETDLEGSAR